MGGKSTTQTSHQQRDPWAPATPLLQQTLGGMQSWLDGPMAFETYKGPLMAGMSDQTRAGLDGLGQAGSGAGASYMKDVMGGKYLDAGNPHLDALKSRVMADVMPGINAQFGKSGMVGSTLHQGSLARGVTDGLAPSLFQNYENERNRQMQAAGQVTGMERQSSLDQIMGGQVREGYDQKNIDADRWRFEQERTAGLRPYQEMFPMLSGIAGMGGTQDGTTTTREKTPAWQTALGAGMMGLGLMTGMPGLGMGGMGAMGGMGGMFGSGFPGMGGFGMGGFGSPYTNPYGFANPTQRS